MFILLYFISVTLKIKILLTKFLENKRPIETKLTVKK